MRHPSRKHKVYTLSMTRKDEARIRAIMAALVAQSGGVQVGPSAAVRWAMTHAERLLGIQGTGPGTASPIGGPTGGTEASHG